MDRSEGEMNAKVDDRGTLMEPLFLCIKSEPDSEKAPERNVTEYNFQTTEIREDVVSNECAQKRDIDDTRELMKPLFVTIKSEPDFDSFSEESSLEENFEAAEYTEDIFVGEYGMKKDMKDAEASMTSFFVPTEAESGFVNASGEIVLDDSQARKITEVCVSPPSFLVKEEPIDAEETWQENIKLEPTCPLSINAQSGGSDNSSEDGVNVKGSFIETSQRPDIISNTASSSLQVASTSAQYLPVEVRGMNNQKDIYFSERSPGQRPFAVGSVDHSLYISGDVAARYLMEGPRVEMLAGIGQHTGGKRFKCNQCEKLFKTNYKLTVHLRTHNGEKPYKCFQCGKASNTNDKLAIHMKTHSKERSYLCAECGKTFPHRSTLSKHMRKHSGEKPFQCSQCEKSFTESGTLIVHMRLHTGEKPYKCTLCGMEFHRSSCLSSHMRSHSMERPFQCPHCEKNFTHRSTLTKHIRTHTGERPYKCTQCEKSFTESGTLTAHVRTHTGERPYQCAQCMKSFTVSSKLTEHMRTHTGELSYTCMLCGEMFKFSTHLSYHIRRLHMAAPSNS